MTPDRDSPSSPAPRRRTSGRRPPAPSLPPSAEAARGALRPGLLFGALVIVVDLAAMAIGQRLPSDSGMAAAVDSLDFLLSVSLYSLAGTLVYRATGSIRLGLSAGMAGGALAGAVVGTASALTGYPAGAEDVSPADLWLFLVLFNVSLGGALSAGGAWITSLRAGSSGR